jgi:hypothetical protein
MPAQVIPRPNPAVAITSVDDDHAVVTREARIDPCQEGRDIGHL